MKNIFISILICSSLSQAETEMPLLHYKGDYGITYENIDLTSNEKMALVGTSLLFDMGPHWYIGGTLYSAVDGKRGGFFTVGANGGIKSDLSKQFQLKSGVFIGAGGGGAAPQGGGLMLRPYAEMLYHTEKFAIGAGVSHINFPNGDIESTQGYLSVTIPTGGGYIESHPSKDLPVGSSDQKYRAADVEVSLYSGHYRPKSDAYNTDGITHTKPYTLMGVKLDKYLSTNLYSYLQTAGAGGGDSDGYMEVFGGVGYLYQLGTLPLYIGAEAAIGASGGGRVDTGGGLVYRTQGILKAKISDSISLDLSGGIVESAGGTFSATSYSASLGYHTTFIDNIQDNDKRETDISAWKFRTQSKTYLDGDKLFKGAGRGVSHVDLLGFALDRYLTKNLYISGQTYWAYRGKAGGYAEGIFGVGYHTDQYGGLSLYAEALGGVGGGGGIDIGGGLFGSIGGGISYALNDSWELNIGADYLRNKANSFSTTDITFGVSYKFSLLEEK